MSALIEEKVDQLFADARKQYSNSTVCQNPVTGEHFVPGHDPIKPRKELAVRALEAQARFRSDESSAGMPDMPLNVREDNPGKFKWQSARHYVVEAFTNSLRTRGFRQERHPNFETFVRGVMADPWTPAEVRQDPDLLRRFSPKPLKGLGSSLIFEPK